MLSECSGGIRAYFFVGTRSIIAYRSSGSEPETRGARCRQHTDSDPDEHEQACDEYRIQNGILPFAGKGDYLFHGFDYYGSTTIGHKKSTSFPPVPAPIFHTMLCRRCRRRRQYRHFDDTAALTNEHTIYSDEVAPAKTANCYTLHTGFAQSFQHGFGSFEMFEAAVTLGSGIVIYVYHIFTALVFLGISKPAGYTSGTRNFPEVLCVHSRNSGINTARICA